MANFSFLCREVKSNKNGLAPIELSIVIPTAEKKRTYITLPVKCNPTEFKEKLQSNNNNEILEYVSSVRNKLTAYLAQMQEKGIAFTADNIKDYFKTGGVKLYSLTQMRDDFLVWKKSVCK